MSQNNFVLGAFWIKGYDKPFFGLRDAKNHQLLKGGDILDPRGKLLYPDPFPKALLCTKCENRIIPTEESEALETPQTVCNDCGGGSGTVQAKSQKKESKGKKGFFGFFKGT